MVSYHTDDMYFPGIQSPGRVDWGFPEQWVQQYRQEKLKDADPMPRLAAQRTQPFLWSEVSQLKVLSTQEMAFLDHMANANLGDGLAMQVYGPEKRNAYVSLGFGTYSIDLNPDEIFELYSAAQTAHVAFCGLILQRDRPIVPLSPRELEILRWVARGKSNQVIADILGISRHTVDTMLRRMFEKLEVHDRTTAAIRGLDAGLIRYRGSVVM